MLYRQFFQASKSLGQYRDDYINRQPGVLYRTLSPRLAALKPEDITQKSKGVPLFLALWLKSI